jgi:spore coat protein A, manganese oxidase
VGLAPPSPFEVFFITRREFFLNAGMASAAAMHQHQHPAAAVTYRPTIDPDSLSPFVDPLPIPPIAKPAGLRPDPFNQSNKIPYYRVSIQEIQAKVHRDLPATRLWSYGGSVPGPTFETRSDAGILVEWANDLPRKHFLPIDHTLHGAETKLPDVRTVVHLHGAKAPADSDGYPENWYEPGHSALYHYPNHQEPAMLWYHDHTMGINRLNTYAGLVGAYIIRDPIEDALNLPTGKFDVPLILFDRFFTADGQLYYPVSNAPQAPWIPELFANALLVNGKLLPYLDVEPRRYRFRILNGSNARFYRLTLDNGQPFTQIGCDQGLLHAPIQLRMLVLAPAERVDIIIDFSGHTGEKIVVKNDVLTMMQFRVGGKGATDTSALPGTLRPVAKIPESAAIKTRQLTLDEVDDLTGKSYKMLLNGTHWSMPVTENPALNSVEIWELINLTDDSHPIHLHLVRFQILDRRSFDQTLYFKESKVHYTGPARPHDPSESGWKDTVRADPGLVTRIIVRFEGYPGRYVWHCHILEHEDNEMMRPYDLIG